MGFFSSRKADQAETPPHDDHGVVKVIRSRLYGNLNLKTKGKERSADSPEPSYPAQKQPSFASPTLVHPAERPSFASARDPAARPRNGSAGPTSPSRRADTISVASAPRSSADVVTVTLAQRLNELATANAEGLLSDDEYRLFRQDLFERFAGGSAVPTETPLVRLTGSHMTVDGRASLSSHDQRPSSNFQVPLPPSRSHTIRSQNTLSSTVSKFLRRATSKRGLSQSGSDTISIFSMASTSAEPVSPSSKSTAPRRMTKHASDTSIRTSISQMSPGRPSALGSDHGHSASESLSRSPSGRPRTRSRSGSSAPPSAYRATMVSVATREPTKLSDDSLPDDDTAETVAEIKAQIELVEAEGRRLLDAFNGLELRTLTRRHRRPPVIPPLPFNSPSDGVSVSTPNSERPSLRAVKDFDAISFKSSGSIKTTRSIKRSPSFSHGKMRSATSSATLASLGHRGSVSSMSSRGRSGVTSHLALASSSSVNLTRSAGHLPLEPVAETETRPQRLHPSRSVPLTPISTKGPEDDEIREMEAELGDIRRRRQEVTARYEARLEYLRARLKGAELREKLLRK